MSESVAVEMTRFHLSLNVNHLSKAVEFLTALLGSPPRKYRADYAKFEPDDLPLVLSLEPRSTPSAPLRNTAGEGALNHVGIRMTDAAQLVEVQRRLEAAGYSTQREDGVECCYARQTKFWVHDNDRTMWEVYVLEEDLEHRGGEHDLLHSHHHDHHQPESHTTSEKATWSHRLSEPFPATIPTAGSLDEVVMQGSWNAKRHQSAWPAQLKQVYSALRPGGKLILHILTSNEPLRELKQLPGPASVVEVIPLLADVMAALDASGLKEVQLAKYGSSPCFVQDNIELRETRLVAQRPRDDDGLEQVVRVVYKGPLAQLVDDAGTTFQRGLATTIPARRWQSLASSPLSESFTKLADDRGVKLSCGSTH